MYRLADSTAPLRLPDHLHNSPSHYNRYYDTYKTPNRGSEIPILLARNQSRRLIMGDDGSNRAQLDADCRQTLLRAGDIEGVGELCSSGFLTNLLPPAPPARVPGGVQL